MKLNELRKILDIYEPEALTKYRGVFTYRVGIFHGSDHRKVRDNLIATLTKAGIDAVVIDSGEYWHPMIGFAMAYHYGDTLKQGSHWWVKFSIIGEK